LDKLRLPHKHHRQQEVRVQVLRRRRIRLALHSSPPRQDNKHPPRIYHPGSNRHHRQENPVLPDNPECQARRPVPEQQAQRVPLPRPRRVLLPPLPHHLQNSLLDFLLATG